MTFNSNNDLSKATYSSMNDIRDYTTDESTREAIIRRNATNSLYLYLASCVHVLIKHFNYQFLIGKSKRLSTRMLAYFPVKKIFDAHGQLIYDEKYNYKVIDGKLQFNSQGFLILDEDQTVKASKSNHRMRMSQLVLLHLYNETIMRSHLMQNIRLEYTKSSASDERLSSRRLTYLPYYNFKTFSIDFDKREKVEQDIGTKFHQLLCKIFSQLDNFQMLFFGDSRFCPKNDENKKMISPEHLDFLLQNENLVTLYLNVSNSSNFDSKSHLNTNFQNIKQLQTNVDNFNANMENFNNNLKNMTLMNNSENTKDTLKNSKSLTESLTQGTMSSGECLEVPSPRDNNHTNNSSCKCENPSELKTNNYDNYNKYLHTENENKIVICAMCKKLINNDFDDDTFQIPFYPECLFIPM